MRISDWSSDVCSSALEPPPFAAGAPADNGTAERISLLHDCSRGFYAWLHETLGERADSIYEGAYRKTVEDAGAADGFPAVLGMVPEHLLTADKLGLLRRSQIEDVLKEKVAQLRTAERREGKECVSPC